MQKLPTENCTGTDSATMLKVLFHQAWSKTRGGRWFNKQEDLPAAIGHARVFNQPGAIVQQAMQGLNNFADLLLGVAV